MFDIISSQDLFHSNPPQKKKKKTWNISKPIQVDQLSLTNPWFSSKLILTFSKANSFSLYHIKVLYNKVSILLIHNKNIINPEITNSTYTLT